MSGKDGFRLPASGFRKRLLRSGRVAKSHDAAKSLGNLLAARVTLAAVIAVSGFARAASACPYCFGDASSDMVKGAKAGVAFLLVVVVGLLVAIANIARTWAKRAAALDAAERAHAGSTAPAASATVGSGGAAVSPRAVPAGPHAHQVQPVSVFAEAISLTASDRGVE